MTLPTLPNIGDLSGTFGGAQSADQLQSGATNNAGAFMPAWGSAFNVGSGSASASASTGVPTGSTQSWLPWVAVGAAGLLAFVLILRK